MAQASSSVPLRMWLKRILSIILLIVIMDALLFGAADRLDWFGAWLLTGLYFAFLLIVVIWATRNAPGLMEERSRMAKNVKSWDRSSPAFTLFYCSPCWSLPDWTRVAFGGRSCQSFYRV